MVVLETGIDLIEGKESHYFIGALIEGDEPRNGELLDFVRVTSLFDADRSGALYLTASDSDSPYMDVIDGLGTDRSLLLTDGILRSESAFRFPLDWVVSHPERLLVSFKIRASKPLSNVPLTIGYAGEVDGTDGIDISTQWEYKLSVVTIDYPSQYKRELSIAPVLDNGEWCEIRDLNIVRLSDIAAFAKASKVRVGKIKGIADPLFGTLDGYGAYFRNLYATGNVHVAGTLTAGDENGFASTFYAGKIHKNCMIDSLGCNFKTPATVVSGMTAPIGMGSVILLPGGKSLLECQREQWVYEQNGKEYCFSFWAKSDEEKTQPLTIIYNGFVFGSFLLTSRWKRYHGSFRLSYQKGSELTLTLDCGSPILFCSPQLESGNRPSLYQPTDDVLAPSDEYGAWFSRGGIGGTIQNPLLRLNSDGSISSGNGSGYFSKGAIRWTDNKVELGQNVILQWENLSMETQKNLKGIDANLLDWVQDWDSARTVIDSQTVITPKIFAGSRNPDDSLSGVAIGRFTLTTRDDYGKNRTESIEGVYGFYHGQKTFYLDGSGNAGFGRGDQSIRYNAATGVIEFGPAVSMQWVGATYINKDGVFTGTLSADTVNAIQINASQITTGTITAERIDTKTLGSILITAKNIEALTLNVTRGFLGGWCIDDDSIYSGLKTNLSGYFTHMADNITLGSAGLRGHMWRLEASGEGALAGGNISWDNAGNITFGKNVTLNWSQPIEEINAALGGKDFPRLTFISSSGIYTGTLQAEQINTIDIDASSIRSGYLSSDRIESDSIKADKIDAMSLKAEIINTDYINGLNCTFTQGKIGGWDISQYRLSSGSISLDSSARRITVFGDGRGAVQFFYNAANDYGFEARNPSGTTVVSIGSTNRIAGWSFDESRIYNNNVVLGADGSVTNTTRWVLNNDGSGMLAAGNIIWDTKGTVTFSPSVSLNWTNGINAITDALGGSSYPKLTRIDSNGIYTGTLTAGQINVAGINAINITAGTLSVDRIAAGSITVDKLNAVSLQAGIVTSAYIEGLILNFQKGTIGGWNIGADHITAGAAGAMGAMPIQIRSAASGSGYWYTGAYKPYGIALTWHQTNNAGHIVLGQIAASGRYGAFGQYLAMGRVIVNSATSYSIKYKTYDGGVMSMTRNGTGLYTINMPWSLGTDTYMVMLSGRWLTGPIYATIKTQNTTSFQVQTQDDPSANEGSFNFVIISTADFI